LVEIVLSLNSCHPQGMCDTRWGGGEADWRCTCLQSCAL